MPKFRMNIVVCLRRLNDAERATVLVGAVYRFATLQIFRNVGKTDPIDTVSRPRRREFSQTTLRKTQNSEICCSSM